MLIIGTVYSWTMFALIVGLGWGLATTTWAYAIVNIFLTTVGVVGRRILAGSPGAATCCDDGCRPLGPGNVLAGLGAPKTPGRRP
jgi:hypothetical protein